MQPHAAREYAQNTIQKKRQDLASKRQAYEQAVAALDADDMYEILTKLADVLMHYNQSSDPHAAAYTIGKAQGYLDVWHGQHRIIAEYHRLRNDLEKLERNYAS